MITSTSTEVSAADIRAALPCDIADRIDELRCATVDLTVPVLGGKVQVGAADPLSTATIAVRRTPWTLTVRRTDGTPLQAQIIRSAETGSVRRVDVFPEPIAALELQRVRHPGGIDRWHVLHCGRSCPSGDLVQLVKTVVSFSLAKQRRSRPTVTQTAIHA